MHVRSEYAINNSRGGKWQHMRATTPYKVHCCAVGTQIGYLLLSYIFLKYFVVVSPHVFSQCHLQLHYWIIWEVVHFRGFPFPPPPQKKNLDFSLEGLAKLWWEGRGGAQRPFRVLKSLKRWVHALQGRVRESKTHYISLSQSCFVVWGRENKEPKRFASNSKEYWHVPNCSHIYAYTVQYMPVAIYRM